MSIVFISNKCGRLSVIRFTFFSLDLTYEAESYEFESRLGPTFLHMSMYIVPVPVCIFFSFVKENNATATSGQSSVHKPSKSPKLGHTGRRALALECAIYENRIQTNKYELTVIFTQSNSSVLVYSSLPLGGVRVISHSCLSYLFLRK